MTSGDGFDCLESEDGMKRVNILIASVGALFLYILSIGPVIGILLRMKVDRDNAELIMQAINHWDI